VQPVIFDPLREVTVGELFSGRVQQRRKCVSAALKFGYLYRKHRQRRKESWDEQ
jgi:hypothetical protein